jgi:hypothetical protein
MFYDLSFQFLIALSCAIAIGTNLSQFICIGRFTVVSFQVLNHMKTILVLTLGFILFGTNMRLRDQEAKCTKITREARGGRYRARNPIVRVDI